MKKILLTFLGTGEYKSCAYRFAGKISRSEVFFSAALADHIRPDRLISLRTDGADRKNGEALSARFKELGFQETAVAIPDGKSEQELWGIFTAITSNVPSDCELHLDITHGFRSLPLLGFIALAYLRTTRNITIGGICYGAWEAATSGENPIAPVFDLTPFLTLLDWNAAAEQFLHTGSASRISALLERTQQELWSDPGEIPKGDLPRKLQSLAKSISNASADRLLLRTGNLETSAKFVSRQMREAEKDAATYVQPFLELLAPVRDELTRHAGTDLATLRDLIAWLAERGQHAAALTLASEWLVSWVMVSCGETNHHATKDKRKPFEDCLNLLIDRCGQNQIRHPSPESESFLKTLGEKSDQATLDKIAAVASSIKEARNDLNHAGFRSQPRTAKSLMDLTTRIAWDLSSIPLP